jgi:hypothetical protein
VTTLLRSNLDYAKQIFYDRLPYGGSSDNYVYGGTWSPNNFAQGCDCSGLVTDILSATLNGTGMIWGREGISTENYRYLPEGGPQTIAGVFPGFYQVASPADFPTNSVARVSLHHEGNGGVSSHMNICLDGIYMESNGDVGCCTLGTGAMAMSNPYWNDFWWCGDGILEDTVDYYNPPIPGLVTLQFL